MERDDKGNSTDKIEITPEMIEAGSLALAGDNRTYDNLEDGARRIFVAMVDANMALKEFLLRNSSHR